VRRRSHREGVDVSNMPAPSRRNSDIPVPLRHSRRESVDIALNTSQSDHHPHRRIIEKDVRFSGSSIEEEQEAWRLQRRRERKEARKQVLDSPPLVEEPFAKKKHKKERKEKEKEEDPEVRRERRKRKKEGKEKSYGFAGEMTDAEGFTTGRESRSGAGGSWWKKLF
jgi:hypothetical protein